MKKPLLILALLCAPFLQAQNSNFTFNWDQLKNDTKISKNEVTWLLENLNNQERDKAIKLVTSLSKSEAAQLLTSYFYMDGSYRNRTNAKYLDSFATRPPKGKAGIIRIAYLTSKLRLENIKQMQSISVYKAEFTEGELNIPLANKEHFNKEVELKFDYEPAKIILQLLSKPNVSYQEILDKTDLHQFNKMIDHRSQSFYRTPINKELLATCIQIAASDKPIHQLYRYTNPYGLLNFSDIKNNIENYKKIINVLSNKEEEIFNYINVSISPLLPKNTKFSREVSFFFMNGADGWAIGDVTALDLNYYKDDYKTLLNLLLHETYHSGQNAISKSKKNIKEEPNRSFENTLTYIFKEGTASYLAPPKILSSSENDLMIKQGITLFEAYFKNTIEKNIPKEARKLKNKGVASAGPFYWLGAEMSRVIVSNSNTKKLASIIPYDGVKFFQTYIKAIKKSKKHKNMFSEEAIQYILAIN